MYDVVVLSPRNYFLFTALLPAACFGNVEEKSIIESIRKILRGKVRQCIAPQFQCSTATPAYGNSCAKDPWYCVLLGVGRCLT